MIFKSSKIHSKLSFLQKLLNCLQRTNVWKCLENNILKMAFGYVSNFKDSATIPEV